MLYTSEEGEAWANGTRPLSIATPTDGGDAPYHGDRSVRDTSGFPSSMAGNHSPDYLSTHEGAEIVVVTGCAQATSGCESYQQR